MIGFFLNLKLLGVILLLQFGLVACQNSSTLVAREAVISDAVVHRFGTQSLQWVGCADNPVVQCATLLVPADYDAPESATWEISVSRLPVTDVTRRLGVLFFNPGGPGLPGIPELTDDPSYWDDLRTRYDIVTFDHRGTGTSSPAIDCLTEDEKNAIRNQNSAPQTASQVDLARRLGVIHGAKCFQKYGSTLKLFNTKNVARDMDILRMALRESKISYLGFSYGTFLGAAYVTLFPEHTSRVVLDSAMNPALTYTQVRHDQALGMQDSVSRFVADCANHADCPLPSGQKAGLVMLEQVIAKLDKSAFVGTDGKVLSGGRAVGLIESFMYTPEKGWPQLRGILSSVLRGNYQPFLEAAHSDALMVNPADSPYLAIMCHDLHVSRDLGLPEVLAPMWQVQAPISGAGRAWSLQPCASWPVRSDTSPQSLHAIGSGPILIMAGRNDPATPIAWARALHQSLSNAHLVEWTGDGHIVYGRSGDCGKGIVESFLFIGELPKIGMLCP
jgi:pimeloyl-ACP methyl ester carboxylesterase